MLAIVSGGVAGLVCFVGLTLLLHRRIFDPRIRLTSHRTDLAILVILWVQLCLGLVTLPLSFAAPRRTRTRCWCWPSCLQRIVTFRPDASVLAGVDWPFKVHMVLGMTIFLLFPFSRLVHVWSGLASVAYLFRPYQVVRSRRLNVPAGHEPAAPRGLKPEDADHDHPLEPCRTSTACLLPTPQEALERRRTAPARLHRAAAPGRASRPACWPPTIRRRSTARSARRPRRDRGLARARTAACPSRRTRPAAATTPRTPGATRVGERVQARHVLFAVTPGVDVDALRKRAEACLLDLRCRDPARRPLRRRSPRETSNCPSGAAGRRARLADGRRLRARVRARALRPAPRWACCRAWCTAASACTWSKCWRASRAQLPAFEAVRAAVAQALRQQAFVTALRQYLQLLAGQARIEGVELDAAATPLVQ